MRNLTRSFRRELPNAKTLSQKVAAILRKYGTDAHVYLPGIGVINGLTAGNYLDSAGTTPITVDNPVGLVLDGAGSVSTTELVSNSTFDSGITGWTQGNVGKATLSWSAGKIRIARNFAASDWPNARTTLTGFTVGKTYAITSEVSNPSLLEVYHSITGTSLAESRTALSSKVLKSYFVATATSHTLDIGIYSASGLVGQYVEFDNVSVKEVTGIHASQATTANKPILRRGAVNLLTYSEQFDNAAWTKDGTVTPNVATAPDGTLTADRFTPGTTGNAPIQTSANNNRIFQNIAGFSAGVVFNGSIYIKTDVINTAFTVYLVYSGSDTVATSVSGTTTGTWTRITVPSAATITNGMRLVLSSTEACLIWGAQLEVGSTATTYIPTTTAAASSSTGNYWWQFDSTDLLTATYPAGYESATVINTAKTGQVTNTAQNIVGTYQIAGAVIGSELVTNGDFSNGTNGWQAAGVISSVGGASISNVAGKLRVTNDATGTNFGLGSQGFTTIVGKTYRVTLERGNTSNGLIAYWYVGISPNGNQAITNLANQTLNTAVFVATSTTTYINLGAYQDVANSWAEWDNISVKEVSPEEYARFIFRTGLTASELTTMQTFANRLAGV